LSEQAARGEAKVGSTHRKPGTGAISIMAQYDRESTRLAAPQPRGYASAADTPGTVIRGFAARKPV